MIQHEFVNRAIEIAKAEQSIAGLAAGGSWIGNQIDEFSDVDLVLITQELVSDSFDKMYSYAARFGNLLNAFTGEHVGEKRLLICMYDNPLLHVDIKFVTPEEFKCRVEDPVILCDKAGSVKQLIEGVPSVWPELNYQWIEDRFWTWIHYGALKIGRGELFETIDFISFLRSMVLAPLMQIKNGQLPRGLRRVEQNLAAGDLELLKQTIPEYSVKSIVESVKKTIEIYRSLRQILFDGKVILRTETEEKCVAYFDEVVARQR
jgi:hypothetical protein